MAWATIGILFATCVNVGVAYWQWTSMDAGLIENRKSADAAKLSADATKVALMLAQHPFKRGSYLTLGTTEARKGIALFLNSALKILARLLPLMLDSLLHSGSLKAQK